QLGAGLRVLLGDGPPRHGAQRDRQPLGQARSEAHDVTTLNTPVSAICASASGTSTVQANRWIWSARSRGQATRAQMTAKLSAPVFSSIHSQPSWSGNGPCQPPKNSTAVSAEMTTMPAYSASRKSANRSPEYSVKAPKMISSGAIGAS